MTKLPLTLALLLAACGKDDAPDTGAVDLDGDGVDDGLDCDDEDPAVGAGPAWYVDGDADGFGGTDSVVACTPPEGYAAADGDCDDADPSIHPGAAETDCADPTDYNCDGSVGYADGDADGYPACEDCDDGDAARSPGAAELCDGLDNDCDGEADADAADATTWYGDSDGDGYGGTRFTQSACEAPAGYVADATDCDDLAPESYPGAPEQCDSADNDCDGAVDEEVQRTWFVDVDGDGYGDPDFFQQACEAPEGYVAEATDCDDADAAVHPDAAELCDGSDNDCDGATDEDATDAASFYADRDGDGHGDPALTTAACEAPTGYVAGATDCDDGDAAVSPDAEELCDSVDNDCDGDVDEDSATDAPSWYRDGDSDGYGDPSRASAACSAPSGYVASATDCDDGDRKINPAATEVCDGADNDCDGATDDDDASLSTSSGNTYYADNDGDGYGGSASTTLACAAPSGYSATATDCDDADAGVNPGASEVVDGVDTNCDGLGYHGVYAASSSTSIAGDTWEFTSFTVASGVTLTVTGSDPLEVYVLGTADIRGTIDLSGEDGQSIGPFTYTPYAGGDGGGGGGGDGGYGGSYYVHGYPYGAAGDGAGDAPGLGGVGYSAGTGGGGGGNLGAGDAGQSSGGCYTTLSGGAGGASVNSSTSPALQPGSGGGGGGYGTGYNSDGGGGGGGGGAFYLEATTLSVSGAIRCAGGDGGGTPGTAYHAAAGGGGSGGTLWLLGDTIAVTGTLACDGGQGGTAYEGGHCGTAGDGGDGADGLIYLDGGSVSVSGTITPTWYKP